MCCLGGRSCSSPSIRTVSSHPNSRASSASSRASTNWNCASCSKTERPTFSSGSHERGAIRLLSALEAEGTSGDATDWSVSIPKPAAPIGQTSSGFPVRENLECSSGPERSDGYPPPDDDCHNPDRQR